MTVAALYVDPRGPYAGMSDVDPWDRVRDARGYQGPHPVVAHPPCGPWSKLAHLCTKQDPTTGPAALRALIRWGGVLEHPEHSSLWSAAARAEIVGPDDMGNMPRPGELSFMHRHLFTLRVDQCRWGHPCRKATWLLFSWVWPTAVPRLPPWREPTHVIDSSKASKRAGTDRGRHLPKSQRHLTPPAFAEWLVSIARIARPRIAA